MSKGHYGFSKKRFRDHRRDRKAGIIIYNSTHALLVKQHATMKWSVPKGTVETGEGIANAALRELYEETGIQLSHSDIDCNAVYTDGNYTIYLVKVSDFTKFEIDPKDKKEIIECRPVPWEEINSMSCNSITTGVKRYIPVY